MSFPFPSLCIIRYHSTILHYQVPFYLSPGRMCVMVDSMCMCLCMCITNFLDFIVQYCTKNDPETALFHCLDSFIWHFKRLLFSTDPYFKSNDLKNVYRFLCCEGEYNYPMKPFESRFLKFS